MRQRSLLRALSRLPSPASGAKRIDMDEQDTQDGSLKLILFILYIHVKKTR